MTALSGDARDRLAAALSTTTTCHGEEWPSEFHYRQIDALLPVVAELADQAAAEELRAAADLIDRGPTFPMPPSIFSALVRERADDIAPTTEGTTR